MTTLSADRIILANLEECCTIPDNYSSGLSYQLAEPVDNQNLIEYLLETSD
jgi:hypothetical protein